MSDAELSAWAYASLDPAARARALALRQPGGRLRLPDCPEAGHVLQQLRLARRLTQAQLAEAVGYSAGSIAAWELGYKVPRPNAQTTLRSFFGLRCTCPLIGIPRREGSGT